MWNPLYNQSNFLRTFKRVLFNLSYAVKISRMIKNIRSSFFYFGARNINTVMKAWFGCATRRRRCCHPCLNVRAPYFIFRARPTCAWQCYMTIILMWVVACTIKAWQLPMLPRMRSVSFCVHIVRICLLPVNMFCCTYKLDLAKLTTLRIPRAVYSFVVC